MLCWASQEQESKTDLCFFRVASSSIWISVVGCWESEMKGGAILQLWAVGRLISVLWQALVNLFFFLLESLWCGFYTTSSQYKLPLSYSIPHYKPTLTESFLWRVALDVTRSKAHPFLLSSFTNLNAFNILALWDFHSIFEPINWDFGHNRLLTLLDYKTLLWRYPDTADYPIYWFLN